MNVARELMQIGFVFNENTLSALKQMTAGVVVNMKMACVGSAKPLHRLG